MRTRHTRLGNTTLAAVATLLGLCLLTWLVVRSESLPDGPLEVIWDKSPCAECSMHVGDPAFAAQMITEDGRELYFDDPGCLFLFVRDEQPRVHRAWFRHLREERWLPLDAVAFVRAADTPMGFGIGAVDPGEAGAMDLEAARREVLQR